MIWRRFQDTVLFANRFFDDFPETILCLNSVGWVFYLLCPIEVVISFKVEIRTVSGSMVLVDDFFHFCLYCVPFNIDGDLHNRLRRALNIGTC